MTKSNNRMWIPTHMLVLISTKWLINEANVEVLKNCKSSSSCLRLATEHFNHFPCS